MLSVPEPVVAAPGLLLHSFDVPLVPPRGTRELLHEGDTGAAIAACEAAKLLAAVLPTPLIASVTQRATRAMVSTTSKNELP